MEHQDLLQRARKLSTRYRVTDGAKFRLGKVDPADTADFDAESKPRTGEGLRESVQLLADLQEKLYAHNRWSLLLIFQGMDASGKDGAIKHVMSGVNPQGCQVASFKAPSAEELDHDFLWRITRHLPERGRIGIFNRSYYEEVLVVRVHPSLLKSQRIPDPLISKKIWSERLDDIRAFERHLARNGTVVRKFFLHMSREEQKQRFLQRIESPDKNWKMLPEDARERRLWSDYMKAYEESIRSTATKESPWYVVPADHKWFTRLVVAGALIDALASLNLHMPRTDAARRAELAAIRKSLLSERSSS
jgi:PPK2 family polyphosphate:nucleotide phosphotransferase